MSDWDSIKTHIQEDLKSKNRITKRVLELAKPDIRLTALARLEELLKEHFPEIISNPSLLNKLDKDVFKARISKFKKLNAAESSLINNIYDLI